MNIRQSLSVGVGLAVILLFWFWAPLNLPLPAQRTLGLVLCTLLFWMTEPVPMEQASLLVLFLFPLTGLLSFEATFAGFATKAIWLIFAGMTLSLGITETALGKRLAFGLLQRLGSDYTRLILGLHLLGFFLAFLLPSGIIRIFILIPVGLKLIEVMRLPRDSRLGAAIIASLICGTNYPSAGILTASLPNLVILGIMETELQQTISWGAWLLFMLPTIGILRLLVSTVVILFLFRPTGSTSLPPLTFPALPPMTTAEKRVIAYLSLAILLWATDFLHQIHPTYVGLGIVLLYFLPVFGVFSFEKLRGLNFPLLFYIAAFFAMGRALQESGFNTIIATRVLQIVDMSRAGWFGSYYLLILLTLPFSALMDTAAVAGVLTPLVLDIAQKAGLSPLGAALAEAIGTSLIFLPYQAAPFMIAYGFGHIRMHQLVRAMVTISLLTLLLLAPLTLGYWHWLGLI